MSFVNVIRVENENFKFSNYIKKSHNLGFGYLLYERFNIFSRFINGKWYVIFSMWNPSKEWKEEHVDRIVLVCKRLNINYEIL